MSYNINLQNKIAKIEALIQKVNKLPEASGGTVSPSADKKAVNFYDYDGAILYSYTVEEAQALTSLPTLPSHAGLICQGWNWSLEDIKSYNRAVNVGAMYITDDGKTRIYIHLEEGRTSPMLGCCPNGTVTVDWGDGSTSTLTGHGTYNSLSYVRWTNNHNYATPGDYIITLTVNGSMGFFGSIYNTEFSGILRYSSGDDMRNYVYRNAVQKVEIGNSITSIGNYAFAKCSSLSSITIPNSVTSIGTYAFDSCSSLSSITLPDSVTSIGTFALDRCVSLKSINIPNGVTNISSNYAFARCYSLSSITIPNGVTSIGDYAFYECYAIAYYDFTSHTSVPILSSTTAFSGIPADCEIRVPADLYNEWVAATNWSTYADYIVAA